MSINLILPKCPMYVEHGCHRLKLDAKTGGKAKKARIRSVRFILSDWLFCRWRESAKDAKGILRHLLLKSHVVLLPDERAE